jgi:hypothetical protein
MVRVIGVARDGTRPGRRVRLDVAHRQPSPGDLARQARLIQPLASVAVHPAGEYGVLPRPGGQLVALQLLNDAEHTAPALAPGARRDALPAQQEPHEVPGGDRLDLAALPLPGVDVNAGKQPPGAELLAAAAPGEAAADGEALLFQPGQDGFNDGVRQAGCLGQVRDGRWAAAVQVAAEHVGGRDVRVGRCGPCGRDRAWVIGHHGGIREQGLDGGAAFYRAPEHPGRAVNADGAAVAGQLVEPGPPVFGGADSGEGHQQVMQLIGAAGVGADLPGDPLDGGGVEPAQLLEHRGTLGCGCVSRPDRHPDIRRGQPQPRGHLRDPGQRCLKVVPDINGQGLQRRHVHHLRPGRLVSARLQRAVDPVDAHQERSQRLPGPGRRRDQRMTPSRDLPPARSLRRRRPSREPTGKPGTNRRVERVQHPATLTRATDTPPRDQQPHTAHAGDQQHQPLHTRGRSAAVNTE